MTTPPERDFEKDFDKADELAVDSRKRNVSCGELQNRIFKALCKVRQEGRNQGIEASAEITSKYFHSGMILDSRSLEEQIISLKSDAGREKGE